MKLLIVGYARMDIYPDKKIPGGAAAGMCLNATTFSDVKPYLLASVGTDNNGKYYQSILIKNGVDISYSPTSQKTPTCTIHDPFGASHERAIADYDAITTLESLDYSTIPFSDFDGIIFANTFPTVVSKISAVIPNNALLFYIPGPHIVWDQKNLNNQTLQKSEVVFANAEEAPIVTNAAPIKLGAKIFVSTHGADDIQVTTKSGTTGYPVSKINNPIDATGAGDCFTLGFIIEYLKSKNIDQSVKAGQTLAEKIIKKQGVLLKDYV